MRMSKFYCLNCYKDMGNNMICPYCGKHRFGEYAMTKEEALDVLRKNKVVLNQEPVVEVDNPAAMTILNCYWLENS